MYLPTGERNSRGRKQWEVESVASMHRWNLRVKCERVIVSEMMRGRGGRKVAKGRRQKQRRWEGFIDRSEVEGWKEGKYSRTFMCKNSAIFYSHASITQ